MMVLQFKVTQAAQVSEHVAAQMMAGANLEVLLEVNLVVAQILFGLLETVVHFVSDATHGLVERLA